ncbi:MULTISPECIES: hypothetical protein [Streptomyces]|jgi:hypothetical protein|uniref:Uncharacterized protein n=2 Tax=Streptomyces TaxID=1883 RepID=A0A514JRQ5_9ACTN|nr:MULTISPECIES: hypothetical protein [Streptomyces]MBA8977162.1 hypothetical protein [Streptomyces calvus]MYS32216.1 hypothetical protein [Streptomyces sp. SID7804]QDI70005.1 hypothetical protein CD934_15830 [Streptomyces calvus]
MPTLQVKHYSVSCVQFRSVGAQNGYVTIALDDPRISAIIYFFRDLWSPADIGEFHDGRIVACHATDADFDRYYELLKTEKPLYFSWEVVDSSTQLRWFALGSSVEPVGEGPRDLSP